MYKLAEIEGIGAQFGHQLMASGVNTSKDLMDKCGTVDKMEQLAQATGISTKQLTTWMHQADLMRVSGIGPEFGQLLERSGVESVHELAQRNPENITHLLARVNAEKRLTRAVPTLKTVASWVDKARTMTKTDHLAAEKPGMERASVPSH
ncbi:MAG: DUF4332 domain-containing protein [Gemmatimonadaceae bacterium]